MYFHYSIYLTLDTASKNSQSTRSCDKPAKYSSNCCVTRSNSQQMHNNYCTKSCCANYTNTNNTSGGGTTGNPINGGTTCNNKNSSTTNTNVGTPNAGDYPARDVFKFANAVHCNMIGCNGGLGCNENPGTSSSSNANGAKISYYQDTCSSKCIAQSKLNIYLYVMYKLNLKLNNITTSRHSTLSCQS